MLCGPPNIGKTYIVMMLKEYFQIYEPAKNSNYYDGFSEEMHKAIVFDVFKGNKTIPNEPYLITNKLDGSLGISYFIDGEMFLATRGSFHQTKPSSEQTFSTNSTYNEDTSSIHATRTCSRSCVQRIESLSTIGG